VGDERSDQPCPTSIASSMSSYRPSRLLGDGVDGVPEDVPLSLRHGRIVGEHHDVMAS
jgi:hypothetical protein